VTQGEAATRAVKEATSTIPIVMATSADPIGAGLVASLARPGGNVTGLSTLVPEVMEHLSEAIPGLGRVAILWQPGVVAERYERLILNEADVAVRALGMRPQLVGARGPAEFDRAFSEMKRGRSRLACNVLHDGDGALAHERDGHWLGAHALARDAARGVGGADEDRLIKLSPKIELRCRRAYEVFGTLGCLDCGTELTRPHNRHMRAEKTAQELICSPIG
jgi:ABC transporter substrate binding protein